MAQQFDLYLNCDSSQLLATDIKSGEVVTTLTRKGVTNTTPLPIDPPSPGETERFIGTFESDDNQTATITHVWIDDAGNKSDPASTITWVVSDVTPPDTPGPITIKNQVEIPD